MGLARHNTVFKTRQNSCPPAGRLTFLICMQLYADMMKSYLSYRAPCPPTWIFARCRADGRALFSTLHNILWFPTNSVFYHVGPKPLHWLSIYLRFYIRRPCNLSRYRIIKRPYFQRSIARGSSIVLVYDLKSVGWMEMEFVSEIQKQLKTITIYFFEDSGEPCYNLPAEKLSIDFPC